MFDFANLTIVIMNIENEDFPNQTTQNAPQPRAKILVVDDDYQQMMVILGYFKDRYTLLYATNGQTGYEIAKKERPDVVIMDWDMPGMDGIATVILLKGCPDTQDIPILMATGVMTHTDHLRKALEAGAADFIRKPFAPLELVSRTDAALRLSQSHQRVKQLMANEQALLRRQLTQQQRALTLQAVQIQENSQFIAEVSEQIGRLEKILEDPAAHILAGIKKSLCAHINLEKAWGNFLAHFEQVHPVFFDRLREDFPTLTRNEWRLCAYMKIGMDNKELAQVLGIGLGTVKSNLNRLKKKMRLLAGNSLRGFLHDYPKGGVEVRVLG